MQSIAVCNDSEGISRTQNLPRLGKLCECELLSRIQPISKVAEAVGGGIVVIFANGMRVYYSEDFLKTFKEN